MTARKKPKVSFEEGMQELETLVAGMQEGGLPLEEMMKTYEQGMALAAQLEAILQAHKKRIEQVDPETGEITAFEENEHGVS